MEELIMALQKRYAKISETHTENIVQSGKRLAELKEKMIRKVGQEQDIEKSAARPDEEDDENTEAKTRLEIDTITSEVQALNEKLATEQSSLDRGINLVSVLLLQYICI